MPLFALTVATISKKIVLPVPGKTVQPLEERLLVPLIESIQGLLVRKVFIVKLDGTLSFN